MPLSLDKILWLSGLFAEAGVIVVCIRGRLFSQTPVFFFYMVWSLVVDLALYLLKFNPHFYFKVYVYELIADSVFQVAVLVELGWAVLRPIRSSLPRHSILFLALLILIAGAIIWPISSSAELPKGFGPLTRTFVHVQQTVAVLRVVFFLALAGFSQLLSIGWKNRELQIATGLGFYSMFSLAITLTTSHLAAGPYYSLSNQVGVASYLCSLIYWIVSFAQKEEVRQEFTPQMRSFLLAITGAARANRVALAESGLGPPHKSSKP
jgi:hypothetical protein